MLTEHTSPTSKIFSSFKKMICKKMFAFNSNNLHLCAYKVQANNY